jgi:signal transduction histidine kinase
LNTALAFTFAGVGLIALRRQRSPAIAEVCAGLVLVIFYLAIVGRIYSASILYSRVMSPYVAVTFGILGIAILCTASRHTFVDTALSADAGGVVFRRMLFAVVVLLPLIGLARVQLEKHGLVRADIATPLFVVLTVSVFTVLTLRTAAVVNQIDRRRKATEEALIRTEKLAAAGRMAATVAHEINNPLEAVTNLLFLLKNTYCEPKVAKEYIRLAEQELGRVAAITRRTLGFYKEGTKANDIDLGKVTDSVLELYAHKLASAGVQVNRSYTDGALVRAAEGEIRQVLTNLLSNSIDALSPVGPRIDVGMRSSDQDVVLTFSDNGTGISKEHVSRIFEPFFTTKREVGNGLGLWVTKALVEKNGGTVELETSTDDEKHGTSFTLRFPRAKGLRAGLKATANEAGAAD